MTCSLIIFLWLWYCYSGLHTWPQENALKRKRMGDGEEGKGLKKWIKLYYIHIPIPHKECRHCVLQTFTIKISTCMSQWIVIHVCACWTTRHRTLFSVSCKPFLLWLLSSSLYPRCLYVFHVCRLVLSVHKSF